MGTILATIRKAVWGTIRETLLETIPEIIPETFDETTPETVLETIPEGIPGIIPETIAETAPEFELSDEEFDIQFAETEAKIENEGIPEHYRSIGENFNLLKNVQLERCGYFQHFTFFRHGRAQGC